MLNGKKTTEPAAMQTIDEKKLHIGGALGKLLDNVIDHWLIDIRQTNPAILDMFSDAELMPHRRIEAWSGEFAGKYLTCAVQCCKLTQNAALKDALNAFVEELLSLQQPNGYIGPCSSEHQLDAKLDHAQFLFDPNDTGCQLDSWDCWGHYHMMIGLLAWDEAFGDRRAFDAAVRIAELFLSRFYGEGQRHIVSLGSEEMNLAVLHSFALLYQKTADERYLQFAYHVLDDLAVPPAGDYLNEALAGKAFYQMPKPRWESLHPVLGILSLYETTHDTRFLEAVNRIWWSITATDVHNTGGFSTWEQAMGSPYREGPVETCCVVAYMVLTANLLRITGEARMADMLELSTYNTAMGAFSPSGRWSTYDTPMEGYKRANYHSICFQSKPGSPDLNCCSVNAPRMLSLLEDWAYMMQDDAVTVNFYGEGTALLKTPEGIVELCQKTQYPYDGTVELHILQAPDEAMTLRLRIPFWSAHTKLTVNGKAIEATAGGYTAIRRTFRSGDCITLTLDMALRVWAGEERLAGKGSVFYGPLVLCADAFYDRTLNIGQLPVLAAGSVTLVQIQQHPRAGRLFRLRHSGGELTLCDLYTAGYSGSVYTTWLPMTDITPQGFTRDNIFRLQPIG